MLLTGLMKGADFMVRETVNRKYKDGIFRSLFNSEEKLIELYNALSGSNYAADTPVRIVTLDNVIFTGIKNDIAFVIEDKFIVLTEHQSTLSPNFPLRLFCYLAREYEKLCYTDAVYSKRQVKIPRPELYVFYDGVEDAPEEWELKLSDAFLGKCDKLSVEAVVKVINVNYDKGAELLQKCRTMQEYSIFMRMIRQKFAQTGELETAVKESIRECIKNDILAEYLMKQRGDIMSILEVDLTLEECGAIREMDGYVRGKEEGLNEGVLKVAKNFKKSGIPVDVIAENTGLTIEEIEAL